MTRIRGNRFKIWFMQKVFFELNKFNYTKLTINAYKGTFFVKIRYYKCVQLRKIL